VLARKEPPPYPYDLLLVHIQAKTREFVCGSGRNGGVHDAQALAGVQTKPAALKLEGI
jgi:hypothetical protein